MDNELDSAFLEANPENGRNKLSKRVWKETKMIASITLPSLLFRVTLFGVMIISQSFIGHISSVDLAAYALVESISMRITTGIILGMSSATETLCGQAFGAKQYHMMGIYLQRSWIVNIVTATILLPIFIFATPIYELLGQQDDISVAAGTISLWYIPLVYMLVFAMTTQMFLQAQMKNAILGYLSSGTFVLNLLIAWLFVYKFDFGIPGVMGAMIISQWGFACGEWVYVCGGWCKETWKGFSKLAFADLLPVIKLSVSSGFMLCLELWYNSILVLIAGYSDDAVVEVSAFSICLNINLWEFTIALALLTSACVRVSNELGRGNIEGLKFSIKVQVWMSATIGIFFCVICLVFGHSIPYLFTSDDEVAEAAANLSVLLAFTMLVSSFQAVFSGVAIGCGTQGKVAIVNVVSYYAIGVPVGCLLSFVAKLGIKGIWIGMLIGMVVQALVLVTFTWRIDWKEEVNKTQARLRQFLHESPEESNQSSDHASILGV